MGAALVVTLVTGADYVVRAVRMSKTPRVKQDDAKTVVSRGTQCPLGTPQTPMARTSRCLHRPRLTAKTRDRIRPALRRLRLRG